MNPGIARANTRRKLVRIPTAAHDDKRQEIIDRCANLFDSGGYHHATMQMLADEVGLGKPSLYHYFGSKAEILYAIHQQHIASLIEGLDCEQRRGASPRDQLIHAALDIFAEIARHPGYVRAFFEHYVELEAAQRAAIRAQRQEYFQKICAIIQAGVACGTFRECNIELAAYGFLGMCSWAYHWYPTQTSELPAQKLAATLCGTFLEGLQKVPQ